jgi:hypothetical protein
MGIINKRIVLPLFILLLEMCAIPGFPQGLDYHLKELNLTFNIFVENKGASMISLPTFKRGSVALTILISENGTLYPQKSWELRPVGPSLNPRQDISPNKKDLRPVVHFRKDLSDFDLDPEKSGHLFSNGKVYLVGLIHPPLPRDSRKPLWETPFIEFSLENGVAKNFSRSKRERIPVAVLKRFKEELITVLKEERNPNFGYW